MLLVTIVWCAPVEHQLFCSLSRTQPAATSVSTGCVLRCLKLTSSSGRQFYKCFKRDGGCDFFLWADSPSNGGSATSTTMPSSSSHYGGDSSQSYSRLAILYSVSHVMSCDPQEYCSWLWSRTKLQMWIKGSKVWKFLCKAILYNDFLFV